MALTISLLALIATFYQLHLQRVHNEKSLKPLAQIDFMDRERPYVHIQNNGVGPLIVTKLSFFKDGITYPSIKDCLTLESKSFQHILIIKASAKVIMAGSHLEIFSTLFEEGDTPELMHKVRSELAPIKVCVEGFDLYNNKVSVERALDWF